MIKGFSQIFLLFKKTHLVTLVMYYFGSTEWCSVKRKNRSHEENICRAEIINDNIRNYF